MTVLRRTLAASTRRFAVVIITMILAAHGLLRAANDLNHIAEVMAGANGDSRIQFIVVRQEGSGHQWGPQAGETQSRAMLVFFDALGRETGSFKFASDAPGPAASDVLIATAEFAALAGAPAPNFTMPPLLNAISGAVCFQSNPLNNVSVRRNCVSYGSFSGFTTGNTRNLAGPGAPAAALPIVNTVSLRSIQPANTGTDLNTDFAITATPTPRNHTGVAFTIPVASTIAQGDNLFNKETFAGNGRTCASCHVASESFRMSPENVQARFATLASTFDPLFLGERRPSAFDAGFDFNLNTLTLAAAPLNASPCNGDLRGIITTPNNGRANVLTRLSATVYLVQGGANPSMAGQVVSDANACSATALTLTPGGLAVAEGVNPTGLENPRRMRRSTNANFPNGRALILENVDGTTPTLTQAVFRKSPHLVNMTRTAPFGFSGDVPDLRTFFQGAVNQHFPRTLARSSTGVNPDFRQPSVEELAIAEAFMLAQEFPPGADTDKFNLDRFATTAAQRRGRTLFFGAAKCSQCHGGAVLAETTVAIQGKAIGINAAFNTGVVNLNINRGGQDNLPAEAGGNREFSVPQLFNIKNLGPFFHDASVATVLDAVNFYDTGNFNNSPAGQAIGGININGQQQNDITAFLDGLVVRPYTVGPGPLSFTAQAPNTTSAAQSLTVTNISASPITFTGTGCALTGQNAADFIIASCPLGATPLAAGESRIVQVQFRPNNNNARTAIIEFTAPDPTGVTLSGAVNNTAPTITAIAAQTTPGNTAVGPLAFTVGDAQTPAASLLVTALSGNTTVVPNANIVVTGTGESRAITLTPATGITGNATITVTVSDGTVSTASVFVLTVTESPAFTTAPANASVSVGQSAQFSVAASGSPAPVIQWQRTVNGGTTWTNVSDASPYSGSATATLTVTGVSGSLNASQYRAVASNLAGTATRTAAALTVTGPVTASPGALQFGATASGAVIQTVTAAQTVAVAFDGRSFGWTAASNQPWLLVSGSGNGAGTFTAQVVAASVPSGSTTISAVITVTAAGTTNGSLAVPVTLTVTSSTTAAAPFGSFDTPLAGATAEGSIAVTGWALDDIGIDRVELWRDLVAGETTPAYAGPGPGTGKVFIANAFFINGARPDVAAEYAQFPQANRAGWGYLLLTQGLWNQGNGPFTLHAFAYDQDGRSTTLGSKAITVNNAGAVKPFGALDTPGYGATPSGNVWNFGWALTPGTTCSIGPGGVQVAIDSGPLQPVSYGDARPDIAAAFPGATNAAGAGGAFSLDTTTLSNGTHQIGWYVVDSCSRAEGIGSRFFTVLNTSSDVPLAARPTTTAADAVREIIDQPVIVRRALEAVPVEATPDGNHLVTIRQDERIEVELPATGGVPYVGYQIVNGTRRALPEGSSFDGATGTFYWQPVAGFLGAFELEFIPATGGVVRLRIVVAVPEPATRGTKLVRPCRDGFQLSAESLRI